VTVYKLFAADTVDEDIYDMGERKSKLSKAVLQDDRQRQAQPQQQPGKCGNNVFIVPVLADVGQCVVSPPEVCAIFISFSVTAAIAQAARPSVEASQGRVATQLERPQQMMMQAGWEKRAAPRRSAASCRRRCSGGCTRWLPRGSKGGKGVHGLQMLMRTILLTFLVT
jgi:hypothetical protein